MHTFWTILAAVIFAVVVACVFDALSRNEP